MEMAFEGIGGVPALQEWAQECPTEFYRIWAKLIPATPHVNVEINNLTDEEKERRAREVAERYKLRLA